MKQKILFVISNTRIGGAELFLLNHIRKLKEIYPDQYEVITCITHSSGDLYESYRKVSDTLYYQSHVTDTNKYKEIHSIIDRNGIELIHIINHFEMESLVRCLSKNHRFVNSVFVDLRKVHEKWVKAVERLQDHSAVVTMSKENLRVFPWLNVIEYGIDTDKFSFDAGINKRKKILWVSRLTPEKGLDILIYILKTTPGYDFTVVGNEPQYGYNSLMENIRVLNTCPGYNIEVKTSLTQDQLIEEYRKHDVFLFTSRNECQPGVILEAMSCGLIPIASDVGSIPLIIKNGVNGYLLPYSVCKNENDILAFVHGKLDKIDKLTDKEICAMKRKARETIEKKHNIKDSVEKYKAIYDKLTGGKK